MNIKQSKMSANNPSTDITIDGDNVKLVIACNYPAGIDSNTADQVWAIVRNFSDVKTIFPSLLRNYISYPLAGTQNRIGTVRDMLFDGAPLSSAMEQLTRLNDSTRTLEYTALGGLSDYLGVMVVKGNNTCSLTWIVTYTQNPVSESLAEALTELFLGGEQEIATVLGLTLG